MNNRIRPDFDYSEAFSRNIGWLTEWEQQILRTKRVAIAGMGGVGGAHLLSLVRLGVSKFHIADFDSFGLVNFNRQVGANMDTVDRPKAEVMAEQACAINPECDIRIFAEGVTDANIDDFLDGVDLFVDGFDFFVMDFRSKVFARSHALGIPSITAAPIGMGAAYLIFDPDGMSFEDYFRFSGMTDQEKYVAMVLGLAPKGYHRSYLADPTRVDFTEKRVASTGMACLMCAGIVGIEAVKILLRRGKVYPVPWYHNLDIYTGRWHRGRIPGGNANPVQRVKLAIGNRLFRKLAANKPPAAYVERDSTIGRIVDAGRWAPSGDNTQPWRFEILADDRVVVHVRDQGDHDIYDYDNGRPTLISTGAMLTNMAVQASHERLEMAWTYRKGEAPHSHQVEVSFRPSSQPASELRPFIRLRSVDRTRYKLRKLNSRQLSALEQAVGPDWRLVWHVGYSTRMAQTKANTMATDLRLRLPECFEVHRNILDWENRFSETKVPVSTLGVDPVSRRMMHSTLKSWSRQRLVGRIPGGTALVKWEMDVLPGFASAAHFSVMAPEGKSVTPLTPEDAVAAGMAVQRFWLTATKLGLAVQPCLAPVIFAAYGRGDAAFTREKGQVPRARALAAKMDQLYSGEAEKVIFRGRIGVPRSRLHVTRSVRRPLEEMMDDRR